MSLAGVTNNSIMVKCTMKAKAHGLIQLTISTTKVTYYSHPFEGYVVFWLFLLEQIVNIGCVSSYVRMFNLAFSCVSCSRGDNVV